MVVVAGLAACIVAVGPTSAGTEARAGGSQSAATGPVSATLTWDAGAGASTVAHVHLKITRSGTVAFDKSIGDVIGDESRLGKVFIRDLDADGEPEVLVSGDTGGTECCALLGIFDYRPRSGGYGRLAESFVGHNVTLASLDEEGIVIVTTDANFNGLFGSEADSWRPPEVLRYEHADGSPRMRDVTRRYPQLMTRDATRTKRILDHATRADIVTTQPVLAAYVADQYLLGSGSVGRHEIDVQTRRGNLGTARQASAYRARLMKLLHRFGYR